MNRHKIADIGKYKLKNITTIHMASRHKISRTFIYQFMRYRCISPGSTSANYIFETLSCRKLFFSNNYCVEK